MSIIPVVYELTAQDPITVTFDGSDYHDLTSYTSHTLTLDAAKAHKRASYAYWRICWTAPSPPPGFETAIVRMYTRTPDASGPKSPIGYILSSTMRNPGANHISNDAVDVTNAFNAFLDAGNYGHIGWDVAGDGNTPITFYTSRLEVGWELGS